MSEQASWRGDGPQPTSGQMIDRPTVVAQATPARTVNADSFKSLLARLKTGAIQQSISIPSVTPSVVIAAPVAPPIEIPATATPAPVAPTSPAPQDIPAVTVAIEPAPMIEPEPAPPPKILAEVQAPAAPTVIIAPEPVVSEPEPEPAPQIADATEPKPVQRRPLVDPELEFVMRLIAAVPSSEERIDFINEAAVREAAEKIEAQPEGELAALEEKYIQQKLNHVAHAPELQPPSPVVLDIGTAVASDAAPTRIATMDEAEASELARSLLDMMASSSSTGLPHERALAADTLLRLVPRLPLKPLILLADRLSIMDAPPHLLIARLLRDPRIEVSGPLIENSAHVTDQDLLQAIAEGMTAKRRLIARRRRVSREISDNLISTGDASVQLTLVRNAAAEISHEGFLKLSEAAETAPDLLAPLCTRADLPAPFAFELFWIAPVQLRRYLLNRFLTDSETLTKILKITLATQGGEDAGTIFPDAAEVSSAINQLVAGEIQPACEKLSVLTKVSTALIGRIFSDQLGEPVAILLKAIGCQRADFNQYVEAVSNAGHLALSASGRIEELQTLFDTMSFNKARILLTYWDWAVLRSGPYAPLH